MIKFDCKKIPFKEAHRLSNPARTLSVKTIGKNSSGWFVKANILEDWFSWVAYFEAFHPDYGIVFGDFEDVVYASSKEALVNFVNKHPYEEWDYGDI